MSTVQRRFGDRFWSDRCSTLLWKNSPSPGSSSAYVDRHPLQDLARPARGSAPTCSPGSTPCSMRPQWCEPVTTCRQPFSRVGRVERHHHARHVREHAAVVIPVAVVLVPLPRAADVGLLRGELRVVVVDLAAQQVLHRVDDAMAARRETVHAVARMIPRRHARGLAGGVLAVVEARLQRRIGFDRLRAAARSPRRRTACARSRGRRAGSRLSAPG